MCRRRRLPSAWSSLSLGWRDPGGKETWSGCCGSEAAGLRAGVHDAIEGRRLTDLAQPTPVPHPRIRLRDDGERAARRPYVDGEPNGAGVLS
uniref:Uncharacterized protein n=1 Tax=Arundo donax TaxID=35708 RepID=A0A0A9CZS2_ARUDO